MINQHSLYCLLLLLFWSWPDMESVQNRVFKADLLNLFLWMRVIDLFRLVWESSLIDNLLNFAGTPKGLLLLQQTGKMNECVAYMNERYNKKLQVQERVLL